LQQQQQQQDDDPLPDYQQLLVSNSESNILLRALDAGD
jgi:hypothetical protein